jgi:hypothetical protein
MGKGVLCCDSLLGVKGQKGVEQVVRFGGDAAVARAEGIP